MILIFMRMNVPKLVFLVDYERGDKFYNAEDENGNQLSLSYQGNNVMTD